MYRKGTQEQNDISIIIGNLPKRLQKKIAEDVGQKCTNVSTTTDNTKENGIITSAGVRQYSAAPVEQSPVKDGIKRMVTGQNNKLMHIGSNKPVLESSRTVTASATKGVSQNIAKTDLTQIPGILRLNGVVDVKLKQRGGNIDNRENGRKINTRPSNKDIPVKVECVNSSPSRHMQANPIWFDALAVQQYSKDLKQLHSSLLQLTQQNVVVNNWNKFCEIRAKLQTIFKYLLLNHLKFCCEQKVDTFYWKTLFYNMREHLKNQSVPQAHFLILALIDDGLEYYTDLVVQLKAKYSIRESELIDEPSLPENKYTIIAKVISQKLLICLGDLCRYKAKQQKSDDYTEAAKFYKQAQVLIPSNGIPYNQLAIIAIQARKKLDAIYYHMRSLMSSNSIDSARESLLVLFDEIRKKYEEIELKASPVHQTTNPNKSKSMRKEVWIYPDGVRRLHRTSVNNRPTIREESRYREMATEEVLRHFISLYLYMIGKFYTGTGMESIQDNQRKSCMLLTILLERSPLVFVRSRMLKTVALNIFILEHNTRRDFRREIRYHAFNFCNQIFGLLTRKCNQLLNEYIDGSNEFDENGISEVNTLLQFIKTYTDWLGQNTAIWEPIRNEEHATIDSWQELEQLFSILQKLLDTGNYKNHCYEEIVLEEDNFFIGFTPLAATIALRQYKTQLLPEIGQFVGRIRQILQFQKCYLKHRKALTTIDESEFSLDVLESSLSECLANDVENNQFTSSNKSETKFMLECSPTNSQDAQLTELTKLKRELEAKNNVKRMYNAKLEEILNYVDTRLYIEVRPKYLLPDTNCFIDNLEDFEKLVKDFKRYTLVIPLTVVKELDGLSKGVKLESYEKSLEKQRIHHFDDVSTRAKKSLDFIKTAKNIKCATTKGSIINASLFALVEEEHLSNDDKILATALALSKTMSTETSKDGKGLVQTELVLVTTDRNLRVKALSRNLAVSELSEFLDWAKDCMT